MKSWLSDCADADQHAGHCEIQVNYRSETPSRLIHIDTDTRDKLVCHVVVIGTYTLQLPLRYAALSYCRGVFKTKMSSLDSIRDASHWPKNISRTVQDACEGGTPSGIAVFMGRRCMHRPALLRARLRKWHPSTAPAVLT